MLTVNPLTRAWRMGFTANGVIWNRALAVEFYTPTTMAVLAVVAAEIVEAVVAAQVHRAVRVALLRVAVLLLRQVMAAVVKCGAEVGCGAAEVAAAMLLPD
jgi:hypothetical protein